jgi:hypothetical protein
MKRHIWPIAMILLVAACSNVVGTPKHSIETFGLDLDQKTVSELEIATELRKLDPCALIDKKVAATFGELRLMPAPLFDLADCNVTVGSNPVPGNNTSIRVGFDISTYQNEDDEEKVRGATVYRGYSTSTDCSYDFPITLTLKERYKPASGHKAKPVITVSVSDAVGADPCDMVRQLLKKPIDNAKSLTTRDAADAWSKLASAHPCAVATTLPKTGGKTTVESTSAFACAIEREGSKRRVSFGSSTKKGLTGADTTVKKIDGHDVTVYDAHDADGMCVAFYRTDKEIDLNLPGKDKTEDGFAYPTIRVNAKCDEIVDFTAKTIQAAGF